MIHGPCGALNLNSPCMIDGKCSKRYPRALTSDTITGDDGYPYYRRRSTEDNGHTVTIRIQNQDIEVDNRWVVPYSPLLSKIFKAHINFEYCIWANRSNTFASISTKAVIWLFRSSF